MVLKNSTSKNRVKKKGGDIVRRIDNHTVDMPCSILQVLHRHQGSENPPDRCTRPAGISWNQCVTSLQEGFIDSERRVKGRERALNATKRGMEDLARRKQEEAEARRREVRESVGWPLAGLLWDPMT